MLLKKQKRQEDLQHIYKPKHKKERGKTKKTKLNAHNNSSNDST